MALTPEARATRIVELEAQVLFLKAENQVWRSLMAEFRELVTQIRQSFPLSQGFERIRKCMGSAEAMDAEVDKILNPPPPKPPPKGKQ